MKLVADARNWWRWHSTYVFGALAALPTVWIESPELQVMVPPKVAAAIVPVLAGIGFFVRIRGQVAKLPAPVNPEP